MLIKRIIALIVMLGWSIRGTGCSDGPIIGLVLLHVKSAQYPSNYNFVVKAYSKWLEQVNIRWIPMYIDEPESETERKLQLVDGLFLTGGSEPFWKFSY